MLTLHERARSNYTTTIRDKESPAREIVGDANVGAGDPGGGDKVHTLLLFADAEAEAAAAAGSPHFGGRARGILAARKAAVRLISHLARGAESSVAFASMSMEEIYELEKGKKCDVM